MKKGLLVILALTVLFAGAVFAASCTSDSKKCPDGTSVSRDPNNNCEFKPCPERQYCDAASNCSANLKCYKFEDSEQAYCYYGDPCQNCASKKCTVVKLFPTQVTCIVVSTPTVQPTPTPTPESECKNLYWFDSTTKECGYKEFCGLYMYYGLQTFETKEECVKALSPVACTQEAKICSDGSYVARDPNNNCEFKPCPEETTSECKYLYWFDSQAKACGYQKFCGAYMYYGLQTFSNYDECLKALGSGGTTVTQPNVVVSTETTTTMGGGASTTTVYSVGACSAKAQPTICTQEYAPVCATIEQFNTDGGYTKYKKTFSNACAACAASTKTDLVVEYVSGKCEEETDSSCPLISTPSPEFCPNGTIEPKYGEINGKKCIVGYDCQGGSEEPADEMPVFYYASAGGLAYSEKTLELYKSGLILETTYLNGQRSKKKGYTSSEKAEEFLKNLDAKGFFELQLSDTSCCITLENGTMQCGADMPIQKMYAISPKENSVAWCLLAKEPEAITYALKMIEEWRQLLEESNYDTEKWVKLGEPFNLSLGEKAIVSETGLTAKLEGMDVESYTVKLSVRGATYGSDQWVKIKAGESATILDHTITLNSVLFPQCTTTTDGTENMTQCIGGKPYANLTITKAETGNAITAFLGDKFEIGNGDSAKILSPEKKELMKIMLEGIDMAADCPVQEKCKESGKCIQIWCDMRARAKLLVSIPVRANCIGETNCIGGEYKVTPIAISEGETQNIGEYKIYFAGLNGNNAVFVVNKIEDDIDYIKVALGEEFKLADGQTALIIDRDIFVTLQQSVAASEDGYAIVSVWKKGWGVVPLPLTEEAKQKTDTIKENMATAGVQSSTQEMPAISGGSSGAVFYKKTYVLKLGESLKIYEIKLSLLGLAGGSAKFLAEELPYSDDTINVQVGEQFKLKENMKARVLEANMLIDMLGIGEEDIACAETSSTCTSTPTVKIGVSNYLFEKGSMGTTVSSQQISENSKSSIIESNSGSTTSGGQASATMPVPLVAAISGATSASQPQKAEPVAPIEIPMPFQIYKLQEGQSVTVGDFEITAKAIWSDYAEFIVTEKGTGLEFKISIAKGWNLFSIPGEIKTIEMSNCSLGDFRLFEYKEGKFEKAKKAEAGKAYWLYNPKEACTIKAELVAPTSLFELKPLQKGWNFVPVLKDMFEKQIGKMGDCKLKGAFFYDTEGTQWVNALETTLAAEHLGKALAVYAEDKCILAGTDTPIPDIPELPALPEVG